MFPYWHDFPTFHPLIVHLPVVLIPLSPLLLTLGILLRNQSLTWVGIACLGLGWLGGLLSGEVFHPHVDAMTLLAQETLEAHEYWAKWTVGLSAAGALLGAFGALVSVQPWHRLLMGLALCFALGAALSVILAGHQGAVLTHVHKIEIE